MSLLQGTNKPTNHRVVSLIPCTAEHVRVTLNMTLITHSSTIMYVKLPNNNIPKLINRSDLLICMNILRSILVTILSSVSSKQKPVGPVAPEGGAVYRASTMVPCTDVHVTHATCTNAHPDHHGCCLLSCSLITSQVVPLLLSLEDAASVTFKKNFSF